MRILFVCSGNAYRSPLAEALLKKLRPDLQVDSAGTMVETRISEETRMYLKGENAVQCLKRARESLEAKRLSEYDLIVAMEQVHKDTILSECPQCRSKVVVWNIADLGIRPPEDLGKINRSIKEKVTELARIL
jgi:protein-tyrosine phosphatase